jgi:catechol 2,3-dioxygenase-like lactoylglutathione lyase family enzyme
MEATARISHVYGYATDLAAMRAFYEGLLGLRVKGVYADSFIEFNAGVKLVFMLATVSNEVGQAPPPVNSSLSSLPGWEGGDAQSALCSLQCSRPQLDAIHDRLAAAGVTCTAPTLRDGAWELRALDPMGNTVELYAIDAA